jgi:uncharacterized membrane protein
MDGTQTRRLTPLVVCVFIAVVFGIFFRFYHIDRKVFWDDEIFSAIRIAGYSEQTVIKAAAEARTAGELQAILHSDTSRRRNSLLATLSGLINEEPQHTPMYFVLGHLWSSVFGDSVKNLRLFSAVLGVLALPAMFWLCAELYGSARAGWIGTALLATAPIAVLYSQEMRDYELWTVAILLTGASLLRAMRLQTVRSWILFAVLLAFSLYVFVLSIFIALGFAVFVALSSWKNQRIMRYACASFAAAVFLFSPWLAVIALKIGEVNRGMSTLFTHRYGVSYIMQRSFGSLRLNFFDYNAQSTGLNLILSILVFALFAYAMYFLRRKSSFRTWGFVLALMLPATIPLIVHDLLFSGMLTVQTRYFTPAFLAADLALVGLFDAVLDSSMTGAVMQARTWNVIFVAVLLGRISSCAISSQATSWWNDFDEHSITLARTINASPRPVFLSDNYISYVLSVAEYLRPDVPVNVRSACYLCTSAVITAQADRDFSAELRVSTDVYALGPSQTLQTGLESSLNHSAKRPRYWCIDVRKNCLSTLRLWRWVD